MNIQSAASSRKDTIEAQRLELSNLIHKACLKGHFSLRVQDIHSSVLDEVRIQGYEIEVLTVQQDSYLIKW